ncbi:hypothetical protein AB4427_05970 [Vibrio artabrorum]|uniref:hypothetical protein n=1 Tax=Vibrio artabrorum TaxID=446374 RepID=UPI00354D62F9
MKSPLSISDLMPRHQLLIRAIIRVNDLSKAQKKLLIAIALNTRVLSEGVVITVWALAKDTGYSPGYIRWLSSLAQKKGFLKSTPHFHVDEYGSEHRTGNLYHLTLPDSLVALGVTD